jgi:hypothetical protein
MRHTATMFQTDRAEDRIIISTSTLCPALL